MQIKTSNTSLALGVSMALIIACSKGQAESTHNNNPAAKAASSMPTAQDDIPAPADVAAIPADATTTESGLAYRVLSAGTGTEHPAGADRVTVHYSGWTTDGKMFDSSVKRGSPISFGLNEVIAGWTEGVQLMVVGEKTRFWIPEELAYKGQPGSPAGMLVFDVELFKIEVKPKPIPKPEAPADLNAAPESAVTTASGLKYLSLSAGTGSVHPGPADQVTVHYSGWTTDGELFDSSVMRNEPATFPLSGVIAGWTEGLQLMVEGEKARLWIPEALAYQGQQGAPAGLLVFDVELISIVAAPPTPDNLTSPPADAVTTESGLIVHTMKTGNMEMKSTGAAALLVHLSFWDQTGKMYQSSRMAGTPFPMDPENSPCQGLTEALKMLHMGQSARVWVPENLGFGDQPGAPSGTLVFDLEVMRIFHAPKDLQEAPEDAITTESGLAYKVLQPSVNPEAKSPTATSKVKIHYSGWNRQEKLFDSSYFTPNPGEFPLGEVMPGWTEGIQLMKVGERARFWIPEDLGMGPRPGAPQGDVVFDIELISFE